MSQLNARTILKERFFSNQLLNVDDFEREQNFHVAYRELLSASLYEAGILDGLEVIPNLTGQVQISPGLIVDSEGRLVPLANRALFEGKEVLLQTGFIVLDVSGASYVNNTWLLVMESHEELVVNTVNQLQPVPILSLLNTSAGVTHGQQQVVLARLTVRKTDIGEGTGSTPQDSFMVTVDNSVRSSAKLTEARLPELDASKIKTGTLSLDVIPVLPTNKISDFPEAELVSHWIQSAVIYLQGKGLAVYPLAQSQLKGVVIGLLQTVTDNGAIYYSLGIGFTERLVSFTSNDLQNASLQCNVYSDRNGYDLTKEGYAGESVKSVQFVGVDQVYSFSLLTPEHKLPPEQQNKLHSLVTFGTQLFLPRRGIKEIVYAIRDAAAPFSFIASTNPKQDLINYEEQARQLHTTGLSAPDAAPVLAGLYPEIRNNPLLLVTLLGNEFTGSTSVPAQMAWSLSIAGISAAQASKALGTYYQGKINMHDFMVLTLGAFPVFSVEQSIIALQEQGKIASEAALAIKDDNPQYAAEPLQMAILMRLYFSDTTDTPLKMVQTLQIAGYSDKEEVLSALATVFPGSSADDRMAAIQETYGN